MLLYSEQFFLHKVSFGSTFANGIYTVSSQLLHFSLHESFRQKKIKEKGDGGGDKKLFFQKLTLRLVKILRPHSFENEAFSSLFPFLNL